MHIRYNSPSKFYEYLSSTGPDVWTELPLDASQISDGLLSPAVGGVPVGAIIAYGGTAAPSGYVLCDGSSLLRASFAALFVVIGTTFGSVDGTHFTVPDLRQRFPLGKSGAGTGSTLGGVGGSIDHTHTSAAHTHTTPAQTATQGQAVVANCLALNNLGGNLGFYDGSTFFDTISGVAADTIGASAYGHPASTTGSTTPGVTGSNNPPFQTVNFIIKT